MKFEIKELAGAPPAVAADVGKIWRRVYFEHGLYQYGKRGRRGYVIPNRKGAYMELDRLFAKLNGGGK